MEQSFVKAETPECIHALNVMEGSAQSLPIKRYRVHYFYGETGMEGRVDTRPSIEIMATDENMAAYMYWNTFFPEMWTQSYLHFLNKERYVRFWGLTITEITF